MIIIWELQAKLAANNNEIQEFITDGMTHIPEDWNVERSDSFDQIEIKEVKLEPIVEIDDSEGINWFDFSISYNLGGKTYSRQELQQLISYNKKGEAYIKLDNQYYILESGAQEEKVEQMLKDAETQADGYRAPYHNLLYYKNLVEKSGINSSNTHKFTLEADTEKSVEKKDGGAHNKCIQAAYIKEVFAGYQQDITEQVGT